MKKLILPLLLLASVIVANGQTCRLQKTVFLPDGRPDSRAVVSVFRVMVSGQVFSDRRVDYRTNSIGVLLGTDGQPGIVLPQGARVWMYAALTGIPGISANSAFGTQYSVPAKASAQLEELQLAGSVLRSQGDLIVSGANGLPLRLPVGANGTMLIADNTQPSGMRWGNSGAITLSASDIPNLDASKITTGRFSFSRLAQINTGRLLGRSTASTGDIEEISLGARLALTSGSLNVVDQPTFLGLAVAATRTDATPGVNLTTTLNNTVASGGIGIGLNVYLTDNSQQSLGAKQGMRLFYERSATATGTSSGDTGFAFGGVFSSSSTTPFKGLSIEGPYFNNSATLSDYTALAIGGAGGTVASRKAVIVYPNSGNSGFGVYLPLSKVEILPDSTSQTALTVTSPSGATAPALVIDAPSNSVAIRTPNMNASSTNMAGARKFVGVNSEGKFGVISAVVSSATISQGLTTTPVSVNFGTTLQEGDQIVVTGRYSNNQTNTYPMTFLVMAGRNVVQLAYPDANHLVTFTFPGTLTDSVNVSHGSGSSSFVLETYRVLRF